MDQAPDMHLSYAYLRMRMGASPISNRQELGIDIYRTTYHKGFLSSQRICFCLHTKQPTKRTRMVPVATAGASSNARLCQRLDQISEAIGCRHYSPFRDLLWNLRCLCRCEAVVWSYMANREIGNCFCF